MWKGDRADPTLYCTRAFYEVRSCNVNVGVRASIEEKLLATKATDGPRCSEYYLLFKNVLVHSIELAEETQYQDERQIPTSKSRGGCPASKMSLSRIEILFSILDWR